MSRRPFGERFPINEAQAKNTRSRTKSDGKHGDKGNATNLDRSKLEKVANDDTENISAWTDFFRTKSWNSRWLNLTCSLWSMILGDSHHQINFDDLRNFLSSLIWCIDGDVSSVEFSKLFDEWLKLDDPWQLSEDRKLEPASAYNFRKLCMQWNLSCDDLFDMMIVLSREYLARCCPHAESCPLALTGALLLVKGQQRPEESSSSSCTCSNNTNTNNDLKSTWINSIISLFFELDCMRFGRLDFDSIIHLVFAMLQSDLDSTLTDLSPSADQIFAMTIETMQEMGCIFVDDVCPVLELHLRLDAKTSKNKTANFANTMPWNLQSNNRGFVTILGFSKYFLTYSSSSGSKSLESSIQCINFIQAAVSSLTNDMNSLIMLSIDSSEPFIDSSSPSEGRSVHRAASKRIASKFFGDVIVLDENDEDDGMEDPLAGCNGSQLWKDLANAIMVCRSQTSTSLSSAGDNLAALNAVTPRRIDYIGTVELVHQNSLSGSFSSSSSSSSSFSHIDRQASTASLWLQQGCWISQSQLTYLDDVDGKDMSTHSFDAACMPPVSLIFPHVYHCTCLTQAKKLGLIDVVAAGGLNSDLPSSSSSSVRNDNHPSKLLDWIETDTVIGMATEPLKARKWCRRNRIFHDAGTVGQSLDQTANSSSGNYNHNKKTKSMHGSVVYSEVDLTEINASSSDPSRGSSSISSLQQLVSGGGLSRVMNNSSSSSSSWSRSISFLNYRTQQAALSLYSPEVSFILSDAIEYIPYTWIIGILPTEAVSADVLKAYRHWQLSPMKSSLTYNSVLEEKVAMNESIFQLFHQSLKLVQEKRIVVTEFMLKFLKSFDSARRVVKSLVDSKLDGNISSIGECFLSWIELDSSSDTSLTKQLSHHLLIQCTSDPATASSRIMIRPSSGRKIWDLVDILQDADDFDGVGTISDNAACYPVEFPVVPVQDEAVAVAVLPSKPVVTKKPPASRNRISNARILQATIASKQRLRGIATRGMNYASLPFDSVAVASSLLSDSWKRTSTTATGDKHHQQHKAQSPTKQKAANVDASSGKSIDQLLGLFISSKGGESSSANRDELLKKICEIRSSENARLGSMMDPVDSTRKASDMVASDNELSPLVTRAVVEDVKPAVAQLPKPVESPLDGRHKLTLR